MHICHLSNRIEKEKAKKAQEVQDKISLAYKISLSFSAYYHHHPKKKMVSKPVTFSKLNRATVNSKRLR